MINLKKNDAIADAVRDIMEKELKGNQTKLDKNHNGKLDKQDFEILRGQKVKEGTDVNDRSEDTLAGRIKTKKKDDVGPGADFKSTKVDMKSEETVEENAFDYKSPRQPEPNGGSGVKQGSRYGGSKQKDEPESTEKKTVKENKGPESDTVPFVRNDSAPISVARDTAQRAMKRIKTEMMGKIAN